MLLGIVRFNKGVNLLPVALAPQVTSKVSLGVTASSS